MLMMASIICFNCQEEGSQQVVKSDFTRLMIAEDGSNGEKTVGVFGGAEKQESRSVQAENASFSVEDEQLFLEFNQAGFFEASPASIGFPESWENVSNMDLVIEPSSPAKLLIEVRGSRSRLRDILELMPEMQNYQFNLKEIGLIGGMHVEPLNIRFEVFDSVDMVVENIKLNFRSEPVVLVDKYGQRNHAEYKGKVKSKSELLDFTDENEFLDSLSRLGHAYSRDKYGGYMIPDLEFSSTGFFHTRYKYNRWWLVTPLGNPFFSLGVNGVRRKSFRGNADVTKIAGRRNIYEKIPDFRECPECFREDSTYFSFYAWNVKQKYQDEHHWKKQVERRLQTIGFNTIGNWSDTLFYNNPQMPFTLTLDSRKSKTFSMENGLPDVFHPDWEIHVDSLFAYIKGFRNDPYLLGYFVDNEMHWRNVPKADSSSYTWNNISHLNSNEQKMRKYAEKYFEVISRTIRKYDFNHLYLGCRFTRNFDQMEGVAEMAGKYADVVSVNVYSAYPEREEMDAWYNAVQKPVLIGEHHIPLRTPKQLWPLFKNFPPDERQRMIKNYLRKWVSYPYSVGAHWYQFRDQEVTGRGIGGGGGENQPVGLVSIADKINRPLANIYFEVSCQIVDSLVLDNIKATKIAGDERDEFQFHKSKNINR